MPSERQAVRGARGEEEEQRWEVRWATGVRWLSGTVSETGEASGLPYGIDRVSVWTGSVGVTYWWEEQFGVSFDTSLLWMDTPSLSLSPLGRAAASTTLPGALVESPPQQWDIGNASLYLLWRGTVPVLGPVMLGVGMDGSLRELISSKGASTAGATGQSGVGLGLQVGWGLNWEGVDLDLGVEFEQMVGRVIPPGIVDLQYERRLTCEGRVGMDIAGVQGGVLMGGGWSQVKETIPIQYFPGKDTVLVSPGRTNWYMEQRAWAGPFVEWEVDKRWTFSAQMTWDVIPFSRSTYQTTGLRVGSRVRI